MKTRVGPPRDMATELRQMCWTLDMLAFEAETVLLPKYLDHSEVCIQFAIAFRHTICRDSVDTVRLGYNHILGELKMFCSTSQACEEMGQLMFEMLALMSSASTRAEYQARRQGFPAGFSMN